MSEELKKAVSERQVEKVAVGRAWVLAMLIENAKRAMQVELVRDREGNPIGPFSFGWRGKQSARVVGQGVWDVPDDVRGPWECAARRD